MQSGSNTIFKLEGRLSGRWVQQLAEVAATWDDGPGPILDLDGLSFIDAAGVSFLRDLAGRGATLTGGSTFITALLA